MVRRLAQLLFFLGALSAALLGATTKSPWLGVWSAPIGDYGLVALNIRDSGDGTPNRVEIWWLVDSPRNASLRVDGDQLFIELPNHQRNAVPGLAFRLTERGTLVFAEHGMLPAPLDPLYANAEFTRPKDDNPWYRITNTYYKTSEWGKWHEGGQLKPLPPTWPAAVTRPLLRLFAQDDHLLHRVLVLPSLPEEDLATAYAWTHDKNIWSNGPDHLRRRIAENPQTPLPILTELWNHPDNSQFWIAAAANPRAPAAWPAMLVERILSGSENVQSRAIWTGDAPPELYLKLIAQKPDFRSRIAGNREMPALVYESLARDYPQESARPLALNPAVPVPILESIAASADRPLQLNLITNPALPPATRARLVRQILASATPADFPRFAHDRDAPPDFLARCAEDLEPGIRTYVAQNPNTPAPLLIALAEDPSRAVASAAREALRERLPQDHRRLHNTFTPIESRPEDVPLFRQFENAIAASDLTALRRLAAYHAARGSLDSMLGPTARLVVRDAYRPAVMDLFLELGFDKDGGLLAPLAGQCGGNAEWLAYFKKHDAFAKNHAAHAYRAALESGEAANLAGLIAAHIDPNQADDQGRTALHLAVLRGDLAAAQALLDHGAKRDALDRRQHTPLDYAVQLKSPAAIRLLDSEGKHAAALVAFAKEFPPAPGSPFLGAWSNGRDGFNTVAIRLNPDGSGRFGGGVISGLLAWRQDSPTEATAYPIGEGGAPLREHPIRLSLEESGGVLRFTPNKGEAQTMARVEK